MRLIFLGTSHGVPEPNRRCSCTLAETGGRYYFIDMGATAVEELENRGIPMEAVRGVFITHMHGDHTNGLPAFCDMLTWAKSYQAADPVICLPDLAAVDAMRAWIAANMVKMRDFRFVEIGDGVCFDDGVLRATAIPTQHCPGSHAYRLEAEGKTVLFTGDLKGPEIDFPAGVQADLAVCEAAHFPPMRYEPVLRSGSVKRVIINHYTKRNIPGILDLAAALPELGITMATDGLEAEV